MVVNKNKTKIDTMWYSARERPSDKKKPKLLQVFQLFLKNVVN